MTWPMLVPSTTKIPIRQVKVIALPLARFEEKVLKISSIAEELFEEVNKNISLGNNFAGF